MRLASQLEARFVRREVHVESWVRVAEDGSRVDVTGPREHMAFVDTIAKADGLLFLCPKCFAKNGGPVGTHSVLCWFVGKVPDDLDPKPGRWTPSGSGMEDLTFIPSAGRSHSVLLTGDSCKWHGFVANGDAT